MLPVLSPLGLDPAHPFPRILNKTLNIAVVLQGRDAFGHEGHMAIVRAPRSLPRIIRIPNEVCGAGDHYVFLAELLQAFVDMMFPGFKVAGSYHGSAYMVAATRLFIKVQADVVRVGLEILFREAIRERKSKTETEF